MQEDSALGAALRFVHMAGLFYCPSELTEPWGLSLPPMDGCVWFHAVTTGRCTITLEDALEGPDAPNEVEVAAGDLVLIPHGAGHRVRGVEDAPTPNVLDLPHESVSEHYALLRHGGGGPRSHLVCGGVRFTDPAARHLVESLPPIIHVEAAPSTRSSWIQATLALLAEETQHQRAGSEAVITRLCDIVLIQAIRSWIEDDPSARVGWLGALRDDQIGKAIACIHSDAGRGWSVQSLADEVAMSRSAFAARFSELVGEPVMAYVTRWRMHVALDLLSGGDVTVAAVAARVGYDSEAAFSRAFKRVIGASPRDARRSAMAGSASMNRTP